MPLRLLMTTVLVISIGGLLSPVFVSVQDSTSKGSLKELALLQDEGQERYFLTCPASISVDARPVTRDDFSGAVEVGLVFGTPRDKSSRSLFGIRPSEQTFRIGVKRDSVDNVLGPLFSNAIEPQGFNRLQVSIERGNVVFSINGSRVAEVGGVLRTRGLMGMYVGGFGAPNIGGRYDNFQVDPTDTARTEECPPLQDDFSNPESGWAEQQSSGDDWTVTWTYAEDGQYEMRKVRTVPMHTTNYTSRVVTFTDFVWSGPAPKVMGTGKEPNIEVDPRELDFGEIEVGQTKRLSFTIKNSGNTDLNVSSISRPDAPFSLPLFTGFTLKPGEDKEFTVTFSPTSSGASFEGTIEIKSNDPDQENVEVELSGQAGQRARREPDIDIKPKRLQFKGVPVGNTKKTINATVTNEGNAELLVNSLFLQKSNSPFSLSKLPNRFSLQPGEQRPIQVTFSAPSTGSFQNKLMIQSNDPDEPLLQRELTGKGELVNAECDCSCNLQIKGKSKVQLGFGKKEPYDVDIDFKCLWIGYAAFPPDLSLESIEWTIKSKNPNVSINQDTGIVSIPPPTQAGQKFTATITAKAPCNVGRCSLGKDGDITEPGEFLADVFSCSATRQITFTSDCNDLEQEIERQSDKLPALKDKRDRKQRTLEEKERTLREGISDRDRKLGSLKHSLEVAKINLDLEQKDLNKALDEYAQLRKRQEELRELSGKILKAEGEVKTALTEIKKRLWRLNEWAEIKEVFKIENCRDPLTKAERKKIGQLWRKSQYGGVDPTPDKVPTVAKAQQYCSKLKAQTIGGPLRPAIMGLAQLASMIGSLPQEILAQAAVTEAAETITGFEGPDSPDKEYTEEQRKELEKRLNQAETLLEDALQLLEKDRKEVEEKLEQLRLQALPLETKVEQLRMEVEKLQKKVMKLEKQIKSLKEDIEAFKDELREEIETLKKENEKLSEKIEELEDKMTAMCKEHKNECPGKVPNFCEKFLK